MHRIAMRGSANWSGILPFANGRFAGLTLSRWAFALRMWLAIQIALGVAFWIQLSGADSAGVIAALLALQTRGQAFEKGLFLFLGTIVGGVMAVVIVGAFSQARDLYVIAYSAWLAVCIFGASFLDGNRAYGAVVCGYTVSIVAVFQIDNPGNVFSDIVNRCAAIGIGILSVLLVVDVFRGAEVGPALIRRIQAGGARLHEFANDLVRDGFRPGTDTRVATILQTASVQHPVLNALPVEAASGAARAGAARATLAALVGEVRSARALTIALGGATGGRSPRLESMVVRRLQGEVAAQRAASSIAFEATREGQRLPDPPRMPIYRSAQNAALNALRAFVASILVALVFIRLGWSQTASAWGFVGILMCFASNAPDPRAMTRGALIAIPSAVVLGGITQFVILGGVDQFPLLMLGTAPALIGSLLMAGSPNAGLASIGLLVAVFTVVTISPSNPQSYDPQSYVVTALMIPLAATLTFVLVRLLLPATDAQRRRWAIKSARSAMDAALKGTGRARREDETHLLDASRIGSVVGLKGTTANDLTIMLRMADLGTAARRVRDGLHRLAPHFSSSPGFDDDVRTALAAADADRLRQVAHALADRGGVECEIVAADLAWTADLIDGPADIGLPVPACASHVAAPEARR